MTQQRSIPRNEIVGQTWNEELARAKKYKEATQKRTAEKQVRKEIEKLKKRSEVGGLRIEP